MKYLEGLIVFFVGAALHWAWSTYFSVWGLAPHVVLVMSVAIAARSGPVAGQCYGFAWGLFIDVLGVHIFGANALLLTLVGYFVGTLRRQMDVATPLSQMFLVGVLMPIYYLSYGIVGYVFEHEFLWVGWKNFIGDPLYNCFICPFAFSFVRRFARF